jgi:predicted DNA-binding transcriptional regulator AlpA
MTPDEARTVAPSPETETARLISFKDVIRLTSLSRSTINTEVRKGTFPVPVRLVPGGKRLAYRESEILEWIASRPLSGR